MFSSTVIASNSEKCWNTMPMPSLRAARGLEMRDRRAVEEDLALVGREDAVDHLDQGRLAGAVLAEQRVDLAGLDVEVDVVVGAHAGKGLADADELQPRGRFSLHLDFTPLPAPSSCFSSSRRNDHAASSAPLARRFEQAIGPRLDADRALSGDPSADRPNCQMNWRP